MVKVLLIEPDKVLASTYQKGMQSEDTEVYIASGAQSGIHATEKLSPDVIVSELQLGEHNGVEFLYELRSYPDWQNIPIIILTSVPAEEAGLDAPTQKKLGIVQYCYKPQTSLQRLQGVVKEVVNK